jgi:hypothetical protein
VWRREADGVLRIRHDVYANFHHGEFDLSSLRENYGIRRRP